MCARLGSSFQLQFEHAESCLHLRYSVSYIKIKLLQNISFKGDFNKIKLTAALSFEMRINTKSITNIIEVSLL